MQVRRILDRMADDTVLRAQTRRRISSSWESIATSQTWLARSQDAIAKTRDHLLSRTPPASFDPPGAMPGKSLINDVQHWRSRAEEMRVVAEDIRDPEIRGTALRIADDYDRLAQRAEDRTNKSREKKADSHLALAIK